VLLRFSKSCKRTVSDGFVKKSADSDSVSDSRRRQPQADAPDNSAEAVIILVRTSPRPSTLHCPICAQTAAAASAASDNYLKLRSGACLDWYDWPDSGEGGGAAVRLFNLPHGRPHWRPHTVDATSLERHHLTREQTTQNRHLLLQKNLRIRTRTDSERIRGFGCGFGIRNNTSFGGMVGLSAVHQSWDKELWFWFPARHHWHFMQIFNSCASVTKRYKLVLASDARQLER